ncbi:MAG: hypothetical protein QOI42_1370 [Frankiaceae bacterium]|jgi:hypothetical protein|nr:hypothetical protein [Frankiaceae bacterium]
MRRLFWVAAGAAVGIVAVRRVTKTAAKLTPKGLSGSLSGAVNNLAGAVRDFAADVREGMAEREAELWTSLEAATPAAAPDSPFDTRGGIR